MQVNGIDALTLFCFPVKRVLRRNFNYGSELYGGSAQMLDALGLGVNAGDSGHAEILWFGGYGFSHGKGKTIQFVNATLKRGRIQGQDSIAKC